MISKLTEQRKRHKQSCIDNHDNSHEIIANLYSDPTHFIFEIIQNAEDTKAKYINFILENNNLVIEHNGKDFDYNDIDSITTIGNSTKKDDINKIGKFGAGFKSVFAVTNTPKIHSGDYHFEIQDFIIPIEIQSIELKSNITKIILPLKDNEVKEKISYKLQNLEMETLLFLNNINEIKYTTNNSNGHYIKDDNIKENYGKVFIISQKDTIEKSQEYFVVNEIVNIDNKKLKISVAYTIEDNQIVKSKSSFLSVFFPTKIDTNLNFLLQAPYRTTPNRETIPFENEQNQILTKNLSNLVKKSLAIIKQEKLININFLELLPIEKNERNDFYMSFYNIVKDVMKTNDYLPINNNSFDYVNNLLLARGKELTNLLNTYDLKQLWDKQNWLHKDITQDKTPKLRDYLIKELEIEEITFEKFARKLDIDFLKLKDDNWLIKFYTSLVEQEALFRDTYSKKGILKHKDIVKLETDEFTSLYDENDRLQVYKPTKDKSEFKTVKKIFIENENSKQFFENYKVTYPDKFSELKEFIYPKYQAKEANISFDEYKNDILKIINTYNTREKDERKKEIIDLFKDCYVVYSSNNTFCKPKEIYLPIDDLKLWFNNSKDIDFIHNEIYNEDTKEFFHSIGCLDIPKRVEFNPNSNDENYKSIKQYSTREDKIIDYNIHGLNENSKNINLELSKLLWKYMLNYADNDHNTYWQPKFYEAQYKYFYRSEQSKKFEANFLKLLKSNKWLYDKNNNLVFAKDITIEELNEKYIKDNDNIKVLEKIFEFKLDEIKKFEENHPDKAIIDRQEYEELLKLKELQQKQEQSDEWKEEVKPEEINFDFINIIEKSYEFETQDLSYQEETKKDDSDNIEETQKQPKETKPKISKKTKDNIGNWGEKFIYEILKKEYNEEKYNIKWLNQNNNIGKGYDFVILENNEEIFNIEVKSKTDNNPQLIEITGTQWEWARKLYNQNEGDKYIIYVVSNAGKKNAKPIKIINPIKQWKNGKLKAHPVNFEL